MTTLSPPLRAAGKCFAGYDAELAERREDEFVRQLEFEVGRVQAQDRARTGLILGRVTALVPVCPVGLGKGCRSASPELRDGQAWCPECAVG